MDAPRILVVVQARTGSSRLPDKVLLPLAGKPLLQRVVERIKAAKLPSLVVVATTRDREDDVLADVCRDLNYPCYRGHPTDLLDRHYQAALEYGCDAVVKIPSDCPLIDPAVIDTVLQYYIDNADRYDFVSNLHPATWPDGQDVEVMPMPILERAWREAKAPMEREHTTPYLWDNPNLFRIGNVEWETGRNYFLSHRWTIDYVEDYKFIKAVFDALYTEERPIFSVDDILKLMERQPELMAVNGKFAGVNWYRHHLDELKTIHPGLTKTM